MQFVGSGAKRSTRPCPLSFYPSLSLLSPLVSSRRLLLLLLLRHLRFRNAAGASYSSHFHRAQTGICPMYRNSRENILSSDRWLLQRRRSDSGGTREYFALVFSLLHSVSLSFLLFLPFLGLSSPGVRCNSKYSNSKDIGENVRVSSGEKCRPPERCG